MEHKSKTKGSTLISMSILIGLIAALAVSAITVSGTYIKTQFISASSKLLIDDEPSLVVMPSSNDTPSQSEEPTPDEPPIDLPQETLIFDSCNSAYDLGHRTDGVYYINTPNGPYPYHCRMVTWHEYTGGWTLVAWQMRDDGGVPWSGSLSNTRDPDTYLDSSFTLYNEQIPEHETVAFGGSERPGHMNFTGGFPFQYSAVGEIPFQIITGIRNGYQYQFARLKDAAHNSCDPSEGTHPAPNSWTFTVTRVNPPYDSWGEFMYSVNPTNNVQHKRRLLQLRKN